VPGQLDRTSRHGLRLSLDVRLRRKLLVSGLGRHACLLVRARQRGEPHRLLGLRSGLLLGSHQCAVVHAVPPRQLFVSRKLDQLHSLRQRHSDVCAGLGLVRCLRGRILL
jgi:hypothetical protein